jgi:hypothetical protein
MSEESTYLSTQSGLSADKPQRPGSPRRDARGNVAPPLHLGTWPAVIVLLVTTSYVLGCSSQEVQVVSGPCGSRMDVSGRSTNPPFSLDGGRGDLAGDTTGEVEPDGDLGGVSAVTVNLLLDEMVSLRTLARRVANPFRTCMVSSFDRDSRTSISSSATASGWYANHDWGNYLGTKTGPRSKEMLLLDADGPGALVRIWSATPSGTLRIYIDGATRPAIEEPMTELLAGKIAPLLPPFAGTTAKGGNLEFPIPFRQHIRVTWDGAGFYQITYREYAELTTDVTSFDMATLDSGKLDSVRTQLQSPILPAMGATSDNSVLSAQSPEMTITASPSGEEILVLQIRPSLLDSASLRGSVLSLIFDGRETVRAPLGDFFGAGPGLVPHATLPLEADADGTLTARLVMPFGHSAVVRIDPMPGLDAVVTVIHRAAPFDEGSYYLHAHWIARGPMSSRPYRDVVLADLSGEGAYVGTFLALGNSSTAWWGEGDEKVWVDDDSFPSLFGTGTEDYFGQGYCSPELYNHPYRAQSLAAGGFGAASGLFSILRAHVLDPIRFSSSLRFDLELWHWDDAAEITFDTISYFYLASGSTDNIPLAAPADFRLSPFQN